MLQRTRTRVSRGALYRRCCRSLRHRKATVRDGFAVHSKPLCRSNVVPGEKRNRMCGRTIFVPDSKLLGGDPHADLTAPHVATHENRFHLRRRSRERSFLLFSFARTHARSLAQWRRGVSLVLESELSLSRARHSRSDRFGLIHVQVMYVPRANSDRSRVSSDSRRASDRNDSPSNSRRASRGSCESHLTRKHEASHQGYRHAYVIDSRWHNLSLDYYVRYLRVFFYLQMPTRAKIKLPRAENLSAFRVVTHFLFYILHIVRLFITYAEDTLSLKKIFIQHMCSESVVNRFT